MDLREYQEKAMSTCMATSENFGYMFINLVGEVGEFASKIAKAIRNDAVTIRDNRLSPVRLFEQGDLEKFINMDEELKKEAGDILWQLTGLCVMMGWELEDIAQMNIRKLADRLQRDKINGEGDNR